MKRSFREIMPLLLRFTGVILLTFGGLFLLVSGYLNARFGGTRRNCLPPASQILEPGKKAFRVAFFGDFAMQSRCLIPVLRDISQRKMDFAVSVGDMTRNNRGMEGEYFLEYFRANLHVPVTTVPGNHDLVKSETTNYEHYFGQPYYYFLYGDTLFIALNNASGRVDNGQFTWLEHVLKTQRNHCRRCVLFMHQPPVILSHDGPKDMMPWTPELLRILRPYSIDAIIAGHLHVAVKGSLNGIPVYISPALGQIQRDTKNPHYGYLELIFPESGGVTAQYHHFPGLRRGRNHILCWAVSVFPGNMLLFSCAVSAIAAGGILLILAGKKKSNCKTGM